ncbi:Tat pathway signal protein [Malaciobacter marinus]
MQKQHKLDVEKREKNCLEESMKEERRSFVKKTLGASALVAAGSAIPVMASSANSSVSSSNGVVVGKSPKKEILYKETAQWEAFYKASY